MKLLDSWDTRSGIYLYGQWSDEKIVKVPLTKPVQIASMSFSSLLRGGEQINLAPQKCS
jgi:hypothetical protein